MVYLYTDGSSRGNPGPGGFGTILKYGQHEKIISEGFKLTTNNRMELMAVIRGLEALTRGPMDVLVVSDSKYVVESVEKKWVFNWQKKGFKDKKNKDLWLQFLEVNKRHNVRFKWIKGHAGHIENERCDQLAVNAASQANLKEDFGYIESIKQT